MKQMKTKEAVQYILDSKGWTRYKLAQVMNVSHMTPHNWLTKSRMTRKNAEVFKQKFHIEITDFRHGSL